MKRVRLLLPVLALPIALLCLAPSFAAHAKPTAPPAKSVTLADGLRYTDVQVGTGPAAKSGDNVTVNYVGKLTSGTVFDASSQHGDGTFSFPLGQGQVIKGWDEGVAGMQVGGQRILRVPPALGYGATGAGSVIPPNATLIFSVKLLKIGN